MMVVNIRCLFYLFIAHYLIKKCSDFLHSTLYRYSKMASPAQHTRITTPASPDVHLLVLHDDIASSSRRRHRSSLIALTRQHNDEVIFSLFVIGDTFCATVAFCQHQWID
jgi:hypothetical protein